MIDVSTFLLGDRCPRCVQRRVYAINPERNLWMCVPNAMPVAMKEHVIEHDAAEWSEDYSPAERELNAEQLAACIKEHAEVDMNYRSSLTGPVPNVFSSAISTQHPRGAGDGR